MGTFGKRDRFQTIMVLFNVPYCAIKGEKVSVRNLSTPIEIVHHMLKIWTDEGDPSKRCKTSNTHAEAILKIFLRKNPES